MGTRMLRERPWLSREDLGVWACAPGLGFGRREEVHCSEFMVCRGWGSWEMSSCHGCAIPGSCCCPPPGVCAQLRLETSGGGVRAPGDSVHFSCQGSGFNFGSYAVLWYRQALGGHPEWLSYIYTESYIRYSPDVEGRATVSCDNSRSVSYMFVRY